MLALFVSLLSGAIVFAQTPNAPLGLVGNARSAHIGNSPVSDGATVYSGDFLSTDNDGAMLVRIGSISVELLSDSSAHIYRAPYGAVLELNKGSVVYSTPGGSENVVIVASDVRVVPAEHRADFGRVTIDDPCNVTVESQRGEASVRVAYETKIIEEGKAYRVRAENSISYRKYLSPEDTDYHHYHEHAPCAAAYQTMKGRPPVAPGQSRFLYVAIGATAGLTTFGVIKALESPSRP
jgi:hypothetical protein